MDKNPEDQLFVVNPTQEPFTYRWGGIDRVLYPGKRVILPRYLAEHAARKLTDHMLLTMERLDKEAFVKANGSAKDYEPKSYLNSKKHRPEVVKQILVGVYSYFQPQQTNNPNAMLDQQLQAMNQQNPQYNQPPTNEPAPMDVGAETDMLMGNLVDDDEDEVPMQPMQLTRISPPQQPAPPMATVQPQQPPPSPPPPMAQPVQSPPVPAMPPAPQQPQTPVPAPPAAQPPQAAQPNESGFERRNRLAKEARSVGIKVKPTMTADQIEAELKKQMA